MVSILLTSKEKEKKLGTLHWAEIFSKMGVDTYSPEHAGFWTRWPLAVMSKSELGPMPTDNVGFDVTPTDCKRNHRQDVSKSRNLFGEIVLGHKIPISFQAENNFIKRR